MKLTLEQLGQMVDGIIAEAKKKKEKAAALKAHAGTAGSAYGAYAEAFDFSAPLGGYNLYRNQGAVNWGPMTSGGTRINDNVAGAKGLDEKMLRAAVRDMISEKVSPWDVLGAVNESPKNIWEAAQHWYDHQGLGLGSQTSAGIAEKKEKMAKAEAKKKKK